MNNFLIGILISILYIIGIYTCSWLACRSECLNRDNPKVIYARCFSVLAFCFFALYYYPLEEITLFFSEIYKILLLLSSLLVANLMIFPACSDMLPMFRDVIVVCFPDFFFFFDIIVSLYIRVPLGKKFTLDTC